MPTETHRGLRLEAEDRVFKKVEKEKNRKSKTKIRRDAYMSWVVPMESERGLIPEAEEPVF